MLFSELARVSNEVAATPHAPPDLVISAFTAPGTGGAGLSLSMTVTVKNQGSGNADPSSAVGGGVLMVLVRVEGLEPPSLLGNAF